MESKAILKYGKITPRKAKIVIDIIRDKSINEALDILRFTNKAAAPILAKLVKSAAANAEHNYKMNKNKLYIAEIFANQGPAAKRIMPKAQGRACRIKKRTSHITVVLKEAE